MRTPMQCRPHRVAIAGAIVLAALAAQPAAGQNIAKYQPVTEARLLKPEAR